MNESISLPEDKVFRSFTLAGICMEQGKNREAEIILRELAAESPADDQIKNALETVQRRLQTGAKRSLAQMLDQWARLLVLYEYKSCLEHMAGIGTRLYPK